MNHPDGPGLRAPEERRVPAGRQISGDQKRLAEIRSVCLQEFALGKLPLRFVDVEVDAARRGATVFFTSESKVDFRDVCRTLSRQLRMRVTLHRLGPRDLARRAGTCGPCGRALCCRSFLSGFPTVSVKVVKRQKFPLTPERSAGMCGRLKCCLAFEGSDTGCRRAECGECGDLTSDVGPWIGE